MSGRAVMPEVRPEPTDALDAEEFLRWYWLKAELRDFARTIGISGAGSKEQITQRIAAHLRGESPESTPRSPKRTSGATQLKPPLELDSVIPPGQRFTAVLRAFMTEQVGPSFKFDGHMREFFASADGRTLADAVDHWRNTRDAPRRPIGAQFEYNTFVRQYRQDRPKASHDEVVTAWRQHRDTPVDRRPSGVEPGNSNAGAH
jgi:hypothetical protein